MVDGVEHSVAARAPTLNYFHFDLGFNSTSITKFASMPAATLITAVPTSISPQEHRALVASTPASFNDIPPILRHKEENVSVTLDPPLEGFAASDGAQGTLYVIERYLFVLLPVSIPLIEACSVLIFMSTTGRAFQIEYPAITLHAVSRAESGPSIYCQLDEHAGEPNAPSGGDEDTLDDLRELIIVPKRDSARTLPSPSCTSPADLRIPIHSG